MISFVLNLRGLGFKLNFIFVFFCRMEAVYLLSTVVEQCTGEVFAQHSEHWVKTLLKILQVEFVKYAKYLLSVHFSVKCMLYKCCIKRN